MNAAKIEARVTAWLESRERSNRMDRQIERLYYAWTKAMQRFHGDSPVVIGIVIALARHTWDDPWLVTARCQSGGWTVVFGNVIPPRAFTDETEIGVALAVLEAAP